MKPLIIGIAGGSGSGKTTFSSKIAQRFGSDVTILCHDYYYEPFAELSLEERKMQNYDHPKSFDTKLLIKQLTELKNGNAIDRPTYSYTEFTRMPQTQHVEPTKVIVLEGFLIFENKELCRLMDIKVFVDTDSDVRIIRRLLRDVKERGRDIDSVVNQYLSTVKPMHEKYVEPSKKNADIIVPEGGYNLVALEMVIERIRAAISEAPTV